MEVKPPRSARASSPGDFADKEEDLLPEHAWLSRLVAIRSLPACALRVERQAERIDCRFVAVNTAFVDVTGIDAAVGHSMRELRPDHEQFWFDLYERVATTGQPASFEHAARAMDCAFRGFAFRVGEPEERLVLVMFENLGEETNLARFGATLAHELRGPLAPIAHGLHILKSAATDATQTRQVICMMERQLRQLTALIDDLMDVGGLRAANVQTQRERVDLQDVVGAAVETCAATVAAREHQLRVVTDEQAVFVRGDFRRLTQVVTNLLTNSCKYTPPGGHIEIRLRRGETEAMLEVRDDGIGVAAQDIPRLFDMFNQGTHRNYESGRGLGIGLAVVKNIIELHGGRVSVRSDGPGTGSLFTVHLPLDLALP